MLDAADTHEPRWDGARSLLLTVAACGAGALAALAIDRGFYWLALLLVGPLYLTYRTHRTFLAGGDAARHEADRARLVQEQAVKDLSVSRMADATRATQRMRIQSEQATASKLESLGRLAGGIAHDFNNILTAILGNISLAREIARPNADVDAALADGEEACVRARQLTRQLLTFSKGGQPVKKPLLLAPLIKDSAERLLPAPLYRWSHELDPDLRAVEADYAQLTQVFDNILTNAKEAMPGGGRVSIAASNVEERELRSEGAINVMTGPYVRISIADEGPGIAPEALARLFEPYFTTKSGGSGMGLAVSHSIVRKHGGYITVDASPGDGTTLHVVLPASAAPAATTPQPARLTRTRPGGRALVMDDAETIRTLATNMLRLLGFDVETVASGEAAVARYIAARAGGRPFDVVLLDLIIPGGIGGVEVLRALRDVDPDVQAIVVSGYAHDDSFAHYREHGFKAAVMKPFTVRELTMALDVAELRPSRIGHHHS